MEVLTTSNLHQWNKLKSDLVQFLISYKFALEEVNTKINILKQEFQYMHDYNPMEHVKSRLKSPESILKKVKKKGYPMSLDSIQENIRDIAGVRITCSFVSDIEKIKQMLAKQKDIEVVECKDYINHPKPNGYRSLHLIIRIPIFMSDHEEHVFVEIQIRTIAMDFWASLEHKIYYKYNKQVPENLLNELKDAAQTANELDQKMENIHESMNIYKNSLPIEEDSQEVQIDEERFYLPMEFLKLSMNNKKEGD